MIVKFNFFGFSADSFRFVFQLFDAFDIEAEVACFFDQISPALLEEIAGQLVAMGAKIILLKLGSRGAYLHTASTAALAQMGAVRPGADWADLRLWAPCFQVQVVGTTGSGDATIAGFLSALLRGFSARQALITAVAVGACNVEAADALSGLRTWQETLTRIQSGWAQHPLLLSEPGWDWNEYDRLWEKRP